MQSLVLKVQSMKCHTLRSTLKQFVKLITTEKKLVAYPRLEFHSPHLISRTQTEEYVLNNEKIMNALFAQQRAQIIHIKRLTPDLLPDSYVYAWMTGLYPFLHDGDYSVPDYPHENFSNHFKVSSEFATEVINYLDDCVFRFT